MKRLVIAMTAVVLVWPTSAAPYRPDVTKSLGFPIYTNNPAGKQLTGNYAPADTPPIAPDETQKKFKVPKGFEVRLFASEPEVVNPVAMTWDERGRLWVLELYEYPKGAPKGQKGRDRVKILEDTDADGRADKVRVFADGFSLATGLALGNGGVYLGVAPDFLFLEDTNGDDQADKTTVLKTGFGLEDRHELLNGFAWGPDGWLYLTHGVFTHSKVRDPNDPDGFGVAINAALARYHPRTKKFEVFADGTSNPWGVDWNERGDAFVSACVIQHLFHMAPGGLYNRQGGTWPNPYGYVQDLPSKGLPAVVDWRHYRAAHAGLCIYQGDQWPSEWRGLVFLGNIHESSINCDRLTPVGATYKAEQETKLLGPHKGDFQVGGGTFLVCDDHWFRPVSIQTGPDGAMWVMDWSDRYPCYQNAQADPEGVDRELGRIWRVVWVGDQPGKKVPSRPEHGLDLTGAGSGQLVGLLQHPNSWQRRISQRLLNEQGRAGKQNAAELQKSDSEVARIAAGFTALRHQFLLRPSAKPDPARPPVPLHSRLAGLWTLHGSGYLEESDFADLAKDEAPEIRAWAARLVGERQSASPSDIRRLDRLSSDAEPTVRAAVATALRQLISGSLTVNIPTASSVGNPGLLSPFKQLVARPSVEGDFYYSHIVWMAMEPRVAQDPKPFFPLLAANESSVSAYCLRRVMRRICDLRDASAREKYLNAAMEFLGSIASQTALADAAIEGLIDAFKSKGAPPTIKLEPIFARLTTNPALADKARRLATLLGDTAASRALVAKINDAKANVADRLKGIQAARETQDEAAKNELLKLFSGPLTLTLSTRRGERGEPEDPDTLARIGGEGGKVGDRTTLSPAGERDGVRGRSDQAQQLYLEAIRAVSAFDGDEIAEVVVDAWKNFSAATRRAAADVLVTRSKWARALLAGIEKKSVEPQDVSATARRALAKSSDRMIVDQASRLLGRYRAPGEDKLKLIAEKRKAVLRGEPDIKAGHEAAKRVCFVCHKLYDEGVDVGPDLTGVGRSSLDALLHNIIDPNEVIGNGYENTEVELKDGRILNGRIVEDTPSRLKLLASGPTEHIISRSEIASQRVSELSLMPEGLEQMPDADFRDLIWYILNPPQDNHPMTPELRRQLVGDDK